MKRALFVSILILLMAMSIFGACVAEEITTEPPSPVPENLPDPEPPLKDVQPDNLITPGKGLAGVSFGMDVNQVENILGRGEIRPVETDFNGNSTISLLYKEKQLFLKFFNGQLFMIIIENPMMGTKTGVHVMGGVGDAIREFGSEFRQEKSLVQDPDPKKQGSVIYFDKDNIAFKCVGGLILQIHLKSPLKIKAKKF